MHALAPSSVYQKNTILLLLLNSYVILSICMATELNPTVQKREKTDSPKSVEYAFNSSWEHWGAVWDTDMVMDQILPADMHSWISFT